MSITRRISSFEALPPEIFNHVLGYLFDPATCKIKEPSTAASYSYRFDVAIFRVSKAVHSLAKSHLHHSLSWIRFDFNWDAFLIDPHWVGVPYISIDCMDTAQVLQCPYAGNPVRRSPKQQAPPGRVAIRIKFPPPTTTVQKDIRKKCFTNIFGSSMSILVLEQDIKGFMTVLRMNDLAYCRRILPNTNVPTKVLNTHSDEGMSFDIVVPPHLELKRYQHLVQHFQDMQGPYHEMTITGHSIPALALQTSMIATQRYPYEERRLQILDAKTRTYVEGIGFILLLKHRGDKCLRHSLYADAFKCYEYALTLEKCLSAHDPQPATENFWTQDNRVCTAFGASLMCNLAIAHTVGALDVPESLLRERGMMFWGLEMARMSGQGVSLGPERYLEITFATMVYSVAVRLTVSILQLGINNDSLNACVRRIILSWERRHDAACGHEQCTVTGKVYTCAKSILAKISDESNGDNMRPAFQPSATPELRRKGLETFEKNESKAKEIRGDLDYMRDLMKDMKIEPLKWAIHEDVILERLHPHLKGLPTVKFGSEGISKSGLYEVTFADFNQLPLADVNIGEKGLRYLI